MRNNQDRLAAATPDPVESKAEQKNSLFDFVNPTEFVDLPTKGRFYPEGHPLQNKEVVEILSKDSVYSRPTTVVIL